MRFQQLDRIMIKTPESQDIKDWHRYFAIRNNNRAWELAVKNRTEAEDQELLNVAHTSAQHWQQIGTELNAMRAKMLLAEVHALLGFGKTALKLANEIKDYFLNIDSPDWEIAYVYTICAHSEKVANNDGFQNTYKEAEIALEAIADPEDRAIVMKTFNQI